MLFLSKRPYCSLRFFLLFSLLPPNVLNPILFELVHSFSRPYLLYDPHHNLSPLLSPAHPIAYTGFPSTA